MELQKLYETHKNNILHTKKRISGIYLIFNVISNKGYIGQSKHLSKRFSDHRTTLTKNLYINSHLQNAWNKYGASTFKFVVLKKDVPHNFLEKEENYYIDKYREELYNILRGGEVPEYSGNPPGESAWNCVLSIDIATSIREMLSQNINSKEIILQFGINRRTLNDVIQNYTWKGFGPDVSYLVSTIEKLKKNGGTNKKLDLETVKKIRFSTKTCKKLAEELNVCLSTVAAVKRGTRWKYADGPIRESTKPKIENIDTIFMIRKLLAEGLTQKSIANKLGVKYTSVRGIAQGKYYKNVI